MLPACEALLWSLLEGSGVGIKTVALTTSFTRREMSLSWTLDWTGLDGRGRLSVVSTTRHVQ